MLGLLVTLLISFMFLCSLLGIMKYFLILYSLISLIHLFFMINKQTKISKLLKLTTLITVSDFSYTLWVSYTQNEIYLYYLPILLGIVHKLFMMMDDCKFQSRIRQNDDVIQQLNKLQNKIQVYVIFYQAVWSFQNFFWHFQAWVSSIFLMITLILIMKFKYTFDKNTQSAYSQCHFFISRKTRDITVFRKIYQFFYGTILYFSKTYTLN